MPSKKPQFIIRTDKEILDKIAYIARENERSSTQEIVYLIKKKIKEFEAENGEIILPEKPTRQETLTKEKDLIKDRSKSISQKMKESFKNGMEFGNADK